MGYTTVPDALHEAGKRASDATEAIQGVDCATLVSQVAAVMPGGSTTGAAAACADAWQITFAEWCREAGSHAAGLSRAATLYAQGDHRAASVFPSAAPGNREPR